MTTLPTPFADEGSSASIGGVTIENGRHRIAIYGTLELTRDKAGLALAQSLANWFAITVAALQADPGLPDKLAAPPRPPTVANPFD